jgi:hypothetical protein
MNEMFDGIEQFYRDEDDDELFDEDGNVDKDIVEIISLSNSDHGLDQNDFDDDSEEDNDYENL